MDGPIVSQVEVVSASEYTHVRRLDLASPSTTRAATDPDHEIADDSAEAVTRVGGHHAGDEMQLHSLGFGLLTDSVAEQRVGVGATPVILSYGAEPEIFDSGASAVEQRTQRAGLRSSAQAP